MKKKLKYLFTFLFISIINLSIVSAASYDVSVTSTTVTVGNSITLTIKSSDLYGRFNITTNNSNITISENNIWLDANSKSITISAKKVGTSVITITPNDVSDDKENPFSGTKTITITVAPKPSSSNGSSGGNKTPVATPKSSNNYLSSLTIDGYDLDSSFSKDKTEYSLTVASGTKKIKINAQLDDSRAKVTGTGEVSLEKQTNKFEIKVTAENGSSRTYTLTVTVKEEDPIEVTIKNEKYTIVRKETTLEIPAGYEKSSLTLGDEEITCYKNNITKNILIPLQDNQGTIKFYSYNEKSKTYDEYNGYHIGGLSLNLLKMPKSQIPEGYSKVPFTYDNTTLEGYQYKQKGVTYAASENTTAGDFYLVYAINELTGEKNLYVYDKLENTIQRYNDTLAITYKNKADAYFLYFLITAALFAISTVVLTIVLIKKNKHKNKFA